MNNEVRGIENQVRKKYSSGSLLGNTTRFVDVVMFLALGFLVVFGYLSWKKLKEQSDMLVI